MQKIRIDRLLEMASSFINDNGVHIEYHIDDDYEAEEDGTEIYSVGFYAGEDNLICRMFNDEELNIDSGMILLEVHSNEVHRLTPYYELDVSTLLESGKSTDEIKDYLRLLQAQLITFGDYDASNDK